MLQPQLPSLSSAHSLTNKVHSALLFLEETPMMRTRLAVVALAFLILAGAAFAADPPNLVTMEGNVEKIGKESLTIQPRQTGGKFGKAITLKLTGTSKLTTLTTQDRSGKAVLVQRDTDIKDLQKNQNIAVIYASAKDGNVLLSAVVLPAAEK
jgi:hypothetical protein